MRARAHAHQPPRVFGAQVGAVDELEAVIEVLQHSRHDRWSRGGAPPRILAPLRAKERLVQFCTKGTRARAPSLKQYGCSIVNGRKANARRLCAALFWGG